MTRLKTRYFEIKHNISDYPSEYYLICDEQKGCLVVASTDYFLLTLPILNRYKNQLKPSEVQIY